MNVRTLCLAVLNCKEATGYEIRKLVTDGHFSHFVDASFGSIYPALARMESDGLVSSREEFQTGRPTRKVYEITDAGRAEFIEALHKPTQPDIFKSEFLLLAMFAEYVSREQVVSAIDAQADFLRSEIATIEEARQTVDLTGADFVAGYGRHCLSASLDYLNAHRAELEAIAGTSLNNGDGLIAAE
ncbi:MAG: PadR family transcriptional regulator [Ahrensia sp.]|nr:PadR family transcriptional regulator [Ahrensia sp.]